MGEFLDTELCENFRKAINEEDIFIYDKEYKEHYNLICAVMDRLDKSVSYLNKNANPPKTEESLLFFIMYSCMILDAVKQLLKSLDIPNVYSVKNKDSYTFFKEVCINAPLSIPEDDCPTDDKFFEYFRSLSMAHPFETSRPKFFRKNEIQYSPWVITNSALSGLRGVNDGIGVRIYSNQFEETQDLMFSFNILKEYINSRFILMKEATEKVYQIIYNKRTEWKKEKVAIDLSPIVTLENIVEMLENRYQDSSIVELAIKILNCTLTEQTNMNIVLKYQKHITDLIPDLIDAVEELDYEKLSNILGSILYAQPKISHKMLHYQLEKIFSYLNDGDELSTNYACGIKQVQAFSNEFAKKWVIINTSKMNGGEIKLLVRVACYFEAREQEQF
ncbi:hypothetical protein RH915_10275 [Serpentinicella sp. ANB-PHB4]|uniref:hypothetical protein n=1 Tax=Serpentinicella sp. ANB-PHB4 TaxID=3074076 RepID=UPI002859C838|nr:hypothetical protein [Serpentinicella sp. ANB-PHB4]MDR5659875.1 hypothetical protein [Serpentinicella sp. ANB-PHB4]